MWRSDRKGVTIIVLVLTVILLWAGPVAAQAPQGTGPDEPLIPTGQWTEIESGDYHWYAFHFDYDADRVADPIEIRLYAEPYDIATLTVRNEEQADLWRADGEQAHFGCCTMVDEDKDEDGKADYAIWAGTLRSSGTYYIVVEHARNVSEPVAYRFTMSGRGFSFPTAAPAPAPAAAAPVVTAPTPITLAGLNGTGPDYALAPTGETTLIKEGEYHWYAFKFDYDEDAVMTPVEIRFYDWPADGATLTVRNAAQAEQWRQEGEQEHFGCCTLVEEDADDDGIADYAVWAGNLRESGTYYIVVEHAKNMHEPVTYHFELTGDGVSY
jgi:hypothetical protein